MARVRRRDVDLVHGTTRFLEKGGKVATKPLPDEYLAILVAAERDRLWSSPGDYLIPNRRPASVRRVERSDKVMWEGVKRVAARAGFALTSTRSALPSRCSSMKRTRTRSSR